MGKPPTKEEVIKSIGDMYDELKTKPSIWRCSACEFKKAADIIDGQVTNDDAAGGSLLKKWPLLDNMYVYLMSVAIENTLKGILTANGESFHTLTKHHNLEAYYNDCCAHGLPFNKEDIGLLKILTHSAIWAGRFNLPRTRKKFESVLKRHGLNFGYGACIRPLSSEGGFLEHGSEKVEREKMRTLFERLFAYFLEVAKLPPCKEGEFFV